MSDINVIIARLGGVECAARLTGVGTEAVRKWRQAGAGPARHWPAVIAAPGLSFADLSGTPGPGSVPPAPGQTPPGATAALVLADGAVFWGRGFGAYTDHSAPV